MAIEHSPEALLANGPDRAATHKTRVAPDDTTWRTEIATVLERGCFPARLADLAAHLAAVRAPSEMLWRLSGVNPDTRFSSLEALIAHIDAEAQHAPRSHTRTNVTGRSTPEVLAPAWPGLVISQPGPDAHW